MSTGWWVPIDVCGGLVEEAIKGVLAGRFLKGTVEDVLETARRKVADLAAELDAVENDPRGHDGPVEAECPVTCLKLSVHAYSRLAALSGIPFERPETVGAVFTLAYRGDLGEIPGVGRTYATEIETALRRAGWPVRGDDDHDHQQPPTEVAQREMLDP